MCLLGGDFIGGEVRSDLRMLVGHLGQKKGAKAEHEGLEGT